MFKLNLIVLALFALGECRSLGRIADPPLQPNFDLASYTGTWYEIYRTKNMPFESGTDVTATYTAEANGTVGVLNRQWLPDENRWDNATAIATVLGNAHLSVKFGPNQPAGDYRVLYTDYNGVSVVYSLTKVLGIVVIEYGWILARDSSIDEATTEKAFSYFTQYTGLKQSNFLKTEHGVAPHGVALVKNRAGPSSDPPLQPNFDLGSYTGTWYEIYRTKNMPFESGTDVTATYTAEADGTVGVLNRQWLPEENRWDNATAVATVVGNAHLAVKFGPNQPAGDYRVLYTDYNGVSVVYSQSKVLGIVIVEYGWILARSNAIDQDTTQKAFSYFTQYTGLTVNSFMQTQHGVAPHF